MSFVRTLNILMLYSEVMDALHILVQQGKVLYLGISDTAAWIVSAANEYAMAQGKTPFSIYQGRWNIMVRDMKRVRLYFPFPSLPLPINPIMSTSP